MTEYKEGHVVKLRRDVPWVGNKDDRMLIIDITELSYLPDGKSYHCVNMTFPIDPPEPDRLYQYRSGAYALNILDFYSAEF